MPSPAGKLRALLEAPGLRVMPCCFDALSALLMPSSPREIFPGIEKIGRQPIFVIHVLAAFLGYASFLLVATAGAMYLVQARELKVKLFGRLFEALPSLETLERLARGATLAGVILFALSLTLGATWTCWAMPL